MQIICFITNTLSVQHLLLNVNRDLFAIYSQNHFTTSEDSETLEFQFISGDTIDDITSDLLRGIFFSIVRQDSICDLDIFRSIFIHEDDIGSVLIVYTLIPDFSRCPEHDEA